MGVYTADEWNKKKGIDAEKIAADKKKAEAEEKKKRTAAAKKKPGYLEPSGGLDKK